MERVACSACHENYIVVDDDFEFKYCCSGASNQCGCMGGPVDPIFCEPCESKLFNKNLQNHKK